MNTTALLPSTYFGPIQLFQKVCAYENLLVEHYEHYIKQTFRSRCDIYSPNGALTLSVPLVKRNKRCVIKDIRIAYDSNWQVSREDSI